VIEKTLLAVHLAVWRAVTDEHDLKLKNGLKENLNAETGLTLVQKHERKPVSVGKISFAEVSC
jgi:hypothetical protein